MTAPSHPIWGTQPGELGRNFLLRINNSKAAHVNKRISFDGTASQERADPVRQTQWRVVTLAAELDLPPQAMPLRRRPLPTPRGEQKGFLYTRSKQCPPGRD